MNECPDKDAELMRQCVELARRAEGRTSPNPLVGAMVLDSRGQVVGAGYHPAAGQPHAEVFAFGEAGDRARGGTLVVTLEPCCHYGRTPPCLDRVKDSGVSRVVIGMTDPNPEVAGKSIAVLRQLGLEVVTGVLEDKCREINRGFIKRMEKGLPWLVLKMAMTLDGKVADRFGASRWISGVEARRYVHGLRNRLDCVMVGSGTVLKDDPQLTVRDIEGGRDPVRLIVDSTRRLSQDFRLFQASGSGPMPRTVIFSSPALQAKDSGHSCYDIPGASSGSGVPTVDTAGSVRHVEVVEMPDSPRVAGKIDLESVMRWVAGEGYNTVLCEGGPALAAALLAESLVDEVQWIVAPRLLMDSEAMPVLFFPAARALGEASAITEISCARLGEDILISGLIGASA